MSSRYYDPEVGRWISPEQNAYAGVFDIGAGVLAYNVYTYCANNPIAFIDYNGEFVLSTLLICVIAGAAIGGTIGGLTGNNYANTQGLTGRDKTNAILSGIALGSIAGGVLGYIATPAIISATGVAGLSVTSSGISFVTITSLAVPEYVKNAGPFIRWISNTFERTQQVLNLEQVKQLFSLPEEYGVHITADLSGHPNTNWPMPHLHFGNSRVHIAIAEEAIDWVFKTLGGG